MNAISILTLELSRSAAVSWAVWGFIRAVTTIVLCITLPPEGDAFVGGTADKHGTQAVALA